MNSKEIVQRAMQRQQTERIPLMCQFSIGFMLKNLDVSPSEFWFDPEIFADGLIELRNRFNFDGILISLYGHDRDWKNKVKSIIKNDDGELITWKDKSQTFCPHNDLPMNLFKLPTFDINNYDIKNLPERIEYIPVSQNLHYVLNKEDMFYVYKKIIDKAGNCYSIHGELTSPFDYYLDYFGLQDALMNLLFQPQIAHGFIEHFTNLLCKLGDEMCQVKIDAIKLSSPFAGSGFISPETYKEFVLPYEKKLIKSIKQNKLKVYTHTCGAIGDRLELILETGTDGLECLDPPPLGDVELEDAFNRLIKRCFIKGNIDSVNTLLLGNYEDIVNDVQNRLAVALKNTGFILSTACSIAPNVNPENIILLSDILKDYNR